MVIKLTPDLEAILNQVAREQGLTAEELAMSALRERFIPKVKLLEPQDEWERELLDLAIDCGTSLSDESLSSEGLYD